MTNSVLVARIRGVRSIRGQGEPVGRLVAPLERSASGYRGADRRGDTSDPGAAVDRSWVVGGVTLGALLVALAWVSFDGDLDALGIAVRSAGTVLAIVVAFASHLYWRATGRAAGYLVSMAGWLIAVAQLAELAARAATPGWIVIAAVALLLAAVWAGRAVVGPEVDTTSGPVREAIVAGAGLAVGAGAAAAAVSFLEVSPVVLLQTTHLLAAAAWGTVTVIGFVRALRGAAILRAWITWVAAAFSLSSGAHHLAIVQGDPWLPIAAALRVSALLIAAIAVARGLSRSALARRDALYRETVRNHEREREKGDAERELAHEIRTALLAIEGATVTLQRHRDEADEEQREQLAAAVQAGIRHLRALVTEEPAAGPARRVQELVTERATLARERGALTIRVQGDPDLLVAEEAGALTQVLDNLLCNTERHGARNGHAMVRIDLDRDGRSLRMRVTDDGPGIPAEARERVFARHERLHTAREGEGIGLHVARRVLRELGGELSLVPSEQGACFEACLPLRPVAGEVVDEPEQGREVLEVGDPGTSRRLHPSPTPGRRPVVQNHRELGSRLRRVRRDDREVEDLTAGVPLEDDGDVDDVVEERAQAVAQQRRSR